MTRLNLTRDEWFEMFTDEWLYENGTAFAGLHGPVHVIMARSLIPDKYVEDYMKNITSHEGSLLCIVEDA